jgi:signal transduction histidine kinase
MNRPQLPPEMVALLEQEKLESLAEFAAGAGHEMNNPLAVITGRVQLLLQSEQDPQKRRELAIIYAQAMRVHEMIADLMLFARPPQPQLANVDLAALCRRVTDEVADEAAQRQISLAPDIGPSLAIVADATQIAVALRALLDNAIEAVGRAGRVSLACRRASEGGGAEIVVADDGPGIADEVRRHLFDPYYCGRSAGRGLGLGLSKCWRIVTNHGGRIEVDSQTGRGATFRIRLPARGSQLDVAQVDQRAADGSL